MSQQDLGNLFMHLFSGSTTVMLSLQVSKKTRGLLLSLLQFLDLYTAFLCVKYLTLKYRKYHHIILCSTEYLRDKIHLWSAAKMWII